MHQLTSGDWLRQGGVSGCVPGNVIIRYLILNDSVSVIHSDSQQHTMNAALAETFSSTVPEDKKSPRGSKLLM